MHNYLIVFAILLKCECSLKVIKNVDVQLQCNSRNALSVKYFFWILKCKHFSSFFYICAALWLGKKASRYVLNNSPLIKNKNLLWIWKRVHHTLNTQVYQSVVLPGKWQEPSILLWKVVITMGFGPMGKLCFLQRGLSFLCISRGSLYGLKSSVLPQIIANPFIVALYY